MPPSMTAGSGRGPENGREAPIRVSSASSSNGDSAAYRRGCHAVVHFHEAPDGYRGAPRLMLVLLAWLAAASHAEVPASRQ